MKITKTPRHPEDSKKDVASLEVSMDRQPSLSDLQSDILKELDMTHELLKYVAPETSQQL